MRNRRIAVALAVAAIAAAASLTACSSSSGAGGGGGGGGKITLHVVGFEGGGSEIADIPTLNAAFEKQYPNVKVAYQYVDNNDYDTYNNTRLAAGTAADVLMTNDARIREWVAQGYLQDLSSQPWVGRMLPNVLPFGQVNGKTYAFVQQNIPIGLYVNQDLLKQAGIQTVPQTWPEFIADLKTLKAQGKNGWLLPNQTGWGFEQVALAMAANMVPDTAGWGAGYNTGTTHWDPTWAPVFDSMRNDVFNAGLVDGKLMNGIDPFQVALTQFESGKWPFLVQGAWALQGVAQAVKFNFSLNPFPGGAAGSQPKGFTFVGSGWGVNSKTSHLQAAQDYVNFMAQPANDAGYLAAENCFTTLNDVPSPKLSQAAPFQKAFDAGDTVVSPIEWITFPTAEQEFWKVSSSFFNAPSTATDSLLHALDKTIPAKSS